MIVGIDLLWVKPNKSGGIESYIRNLLDGFLNLYDHDIKYILFVSKDNCKTFDKYFKDTKFQKCLCNVESNKVFKRILWENLFLNNKGKKYNIDIMFMPIYSKPIKKSKQFPYITVIHDLQALHYPQYFSKIKYLWLKYSWKRSVITSNKIIAISSFVKNDIIERLNVNKDKISVIYNPIVKTNKIEKFDVIANKYNIKENDYFYSVSSMLPHKNLDTILKLMKKIKIMGLKLPQKLVISGVGGKSEETVKNMIKEYNIEKNVILTGFVSNEERDCLYKNASTFLFPSIFEGFGMPPIEAMMNGTPVVTTNTTSIPEVTENKALYVNNPFDVDEWLKNIEIAISDSKRVSYFKNYELNNVSKKYIFQFCNVHHNMR